MIYMMMGGARKVAYSLSFVWFLILVVSLGALSFRTRREVVITVPSTESATFLKKSDDVLHSQNLNFFSKRRVPNGPDPIHNRRVGNTRLPPR